MHSLRFSNDLSSKFFRWWIFEKTRKKRKFRIFREKLWIHLSLEIINLVIDFRDKFWYQIFDFFFSTMKFWISWKKFWTEPIVRNSRRRKNSVKIQEFYFRIPNLCIVLLFVQLDSVLFSLKQTETKWLRIEFWKNFPIFAYDLQIKIVGAIWFEIWISKSLNLFHDSTKTSLLGTIVLIISY